MIPLAVAPDAERLTIDYLTPALAAHSTTATVGVDIPTTWTSTSTQHLQVALDGTPSLHYPVLARATVRLTAWASSTTTAKALVALALGLMCSHPGDANVASVQALTGVLPTRDPDSSAQLASVTVRVNLRMSVLA